MPYKELDIAVSLFSIVICACLLINQFISSNKSKSQRWFTVLLFANVGMIIGDLVQVLCYGNPNKGAIALQTIFTIVVYYACAGLLLFSFLAWIYFYLAQRKKVSKWYIRIAMLTTMIQLIISFTMPLTKICYIDSNGCYQRGSLFALGLVFAYVSYIITFVYMFRYIKSFDKKEFAFIIVLSLIPIIGVIIQILYGDVLLQNSIITIDAICIIVFIQHTREYDKELKLKDMAIEKQKKLEEVSSRQDNLNSQLIDVLCGAVEAKDMYTRGHSMRVAQYAREIMYRLGGSEQEQQEVYYIGILHDVGKISVRDEIINKKGRLNDDEYEQIKLHTIAGYQILRDVNIIPDLAIGARWHHERYDGTGYPNGLAGENIPLIARIISVADAYDAMTSNRSYHSIMSQKDVREQIVKGMGTQFDPKIAQIMLDMIDDDIEYDMKQINLDKTINVLMIDDDPFMHSLVESILGTENYVITFASSGMEGIELLKEYKYDLCLLDMEMPGMNGFEVLTWIHENIRRLKVIFLTGDKDINSIKKSEELGAVDYITKPVKAKILKESINSVLKH